MGDTDLVQHVGNLVDLAGLDNMAAAGDERSLVAAAAQLSADFFDRAGAVVGNRIQNNAISHK